MNVLLLGGYGQFGLPTAKQIAHYNLIEEVVIAGRNLEKAQQAAAEVGPKARALRLDANDAEAVGAALGPGDVLVSFMWDRERYLEALTRPAIRAGAHFCDLGGPSPSPELDAAAREAGVTALIGVGSSPSLTDFTHKMAINLLDQVDYAVSGLHWALLLDIWDDIYRAYFKLPGGLDRGPHGRQLRATLGAPATREARLDAIRDGHVVEMFLSRLSRAEPPQVQIPAVRGGALTTVDPLLEGVDVPLGAPLDGFVPVPVVSLAPPEEQDGVPNTFASIAGFAQPVTDLLQATAARLRIQALDFDTAVALVYQRLEADLDTYLLDTKLFASMSGEFTSVYGRKQGRPARAATWIPQPWYTERNWLDMTAASVALSVVRLMRGDIDAPGAHLLADADTLDDTYLAEL